MGETVLKGSQEKGSRKFYVLFFLFILGVSILLRWPHMFVERLWPDEALYAWNAKRIFLNPEIIFSKEIMDFHPPLFSALLSFMHFFFPPLVACHVLVFLINILGIVAIYFLGRKIQGHFLGCFIAIMLSFNPLYFSMSNYILMDGVQAVFMIAFFYLLHKASGKDITINDLYLSLMVVALILLKWSGGLVAPLVVLYFWLAFPQWSIRERLKKVLLPTGFALGSIGILLVHTYVTSGNWVPYVFRASNDAYQQPFIFYFKQLVVYIIPYVFLPVFLLGLWRTFKSGNRDHWVQGVWFVFFLLVISMMSQKDTRFIFPLIPSVILILGIAVDFFLTKVEKTTNLRLIKRMFLVLMVGTIFIFDYPKVNGMITQSNTFIGFKEAGDYVKENISPAEDALVLVGSPRMIRYFTDINFVEFGGRIAPIPSTEVEFKDLVSKTSSEIIMIVDLWEGMQPKWVYPLREKNVEHLKTQGFELERIIRKDLMVGKEIYRDRGVVWCLRKPAVKI